MTDYYRSMEHSKSSLYIIGILLFATSQNQASLQSREIVDILRIHNMYRRMFANGAYSVDVGDMKKLEWSFELQDKARRRLQCDNINTLLTFQDIKMNIGFSLNRNYSDIIRSWFNEIRYFLPEFKSCQYLNNCSRFLTMINSEQRQVGCDVSMCSVDKIESYVMMCVYDGGESLTDPYKSGRPCTKCTNRESFCDNGLCVPCSGSSTECDCKKTCNKPGVGLGRLNSTTCTCECSYGMGPNCDEQCNNPEIYLDYDICETVTTENCLSEDQDERNMLAEFCPEQCVCNKVPTDGTKE